MAHTPGPWERVGASRIWRTGADGAAVAIIAEPECRDSGSFAEIQLGSKRWDEAMANGQLITAAPKLLAACEMTFKWLMAIAQHSNKGHEIFVESKEDADLVFLIDAIAAAKGKS